MKRSNWRAFKLDELGQVARGKSRHRPRDDSRLFGGAYPFIQTGDVKNANLRITSYSETYNDFGLAQSRLWQPDTLCITIAANIADTAILGIPACFPDSVVGFLADPERADVRFVKYYIDQIRLHFQAASRGTAQDNLSLDKLLRFDFLVPKANEQRRIADVLSAFDDLIENNTKRIKILEEMARSLYREWFVEFRFPGHEKAKFVDTEIGRVPKGWGLGALGDVVTLQRGFDLPERDRSPGIIPIVSSSGVTGMHDTARVDPPGIVTGRYGTLGEVYFIHEPF